MDGKNCNLAVKLCPRRLILIFEKRESTIIPQIKSKNTKIGTSENLLTLKSDDPSQKYSHLYIDCTFILIIN